MKTTIYDNFSENSRKLFTKYYLTMLYGCTIVPVLLALTPNEIIENDLFLNFFNHILSGENRYNTAYVYLEGVKYGLGLKYIALIFLLTSANIIAMFYITFYIILKWRHPGSSEYKEDFRKLLLFVFGVCMGIFIAYFGPRPPSDPRYLSTGRFFRNELILYATATGFAFISISWAGVVTYTLKIAGFRGLKNGA